MGLVGDVDHAAGVGAYVGTDGGTYVDDAAVGMS